MTLVSMEASTDSPTVYRYNITLKDYEYIFITEHSNKFYALFSNDMELFLEREVVSDIINKYGLDESMRSIAYRGFDIFNSSEYDKQGWIIRKSSTTPENIRLQRAKELLLSFGSQTINVEKPELDSIEVKLNKNNEYFDYFGCCDKPEPDFIHYGLLSEKHSNRLQGANVKVSMFVDEPLSRDTSDLINKVLKGNEAMINYEHLLTPKKVIFNGPATIVFWRDGTKTVVKCSENDKANPYNGFCAALAKKIFGNNSKIQKIVKNAEYQVPKGCEDSCPIFETEGSEK